MAAKRKPAAAPVSVVAKKRILEKSKEKAKQNKKADTTETQPAASVAQATELPTPKVVAVELTLPEVPEPSKKKDDKNKDDKKKGDKKKNDKKRGKGKGGDVEDPGTNVKEEANTPEARKEPVADPMTDDDDSKAPLDSVQLKRMMGVLNDQTTRAGVSNEKKKKAAELLDIWKNKADANEKRQILQSFADAGNDGIRPADRIKLCLEFRETIQKDKSQTIQQNDFFFTRLRGDRTEEKLLSTTQGSMQISCVGDYKSLS